MHPSQTKLLLKLVFHKLTTVIAVQTIEQVGESLPKDVL